MQGSKSNAQGASDGSLRFTAQQWGLLLLLAAINFTHILDFVIVMPLGDSLRHQLGITPRQFGAIVSAYGLSAMVTGILSAAAVDRFDRKSVLVTSFGGFTLATFYCGVAPTYNHLLIARSLAGLFGGLAGSSVMAVIGDIFADRQRGKAIGIVTSSFAVASTIGLPTGLWLAHHFGTWNAPFYAIGVLGVIVWFIAWMLLPSLSGHRVHGHSNPWTQFVDVLKQSNHLRSFAFMMATIFGTFLIVPYIAPYLQANCGRKDTDLPVIYAVAGICTLVSMNVVGWATDRFGARPIFLICAGGAVVMTMVITNLPPITLPVAVMSTTLFMVLASGRIIPAQTMMLRSADPRLRGAFTNILTAVSHFATAVGPLITGSVVGEQYAGGPLTGFPIAGWIAAALGCIALALSFSLRSNSTSAISVAAIHATPEASAP